MAKQLEHGLPPPTSRPSTLARPPVFSPVASPVTPNQARVLAYASLGLDLWAAELRDGKGTRTASLALAWCVRSRLLRESASLGWQLTPIGQAALRRAFVAACERWTACRHCRRLVPRVELIGKSGRPTTYCQGLPGLEAALTLRAWAVAPFLSWRRMRLRLSAATHFPKHRGHPTKCECELCLNPPKPPPSPVDPARARLAWLAGEP
ncbi:MAG TPA: hypothetical protein VGI10_06205 [Polyangiaceae bacterium]|jgi:hypothetical protein